MQYS